MKKILNVLKQFTDKKCPKVELSYVYYYSDKNWLVATDTIRLLIIKPTYQAYDKDVFVDVNNKGLGTNPEIFYGNILCYEPMRIGEYPSTQSVLNRVLENSSAKTYKTDLDLASVIMNIGSILNNNTIIKFHKKYSYLEYIKSEIYNIRYKSNSEPVHISGITDNFEFKLIVMPYKEN